MKKHCKICRKPFNDDTNNFQCQSCLDFQEYKRNHRTTYAIDISEIEFVFYPRMHYNAMLDVGKVYGTYIHHLDRIRLNLFAWSDKLNIELITCQILAHEWMHKVLTLEHGKDVSKSYDNVAESIEEYLDMDFRSVY